MWYLYKESSYGAAFAIAWGALAAPCREACPSAMDGFTEEGSAS